MAVTFFGSLQVVPPFPDRPTEGFLHFNVELGPMAAASVGEVRLVFARLVCNSNCHRDTLGRCGSGGDVEFAKGF